jgi:hypothetical protein
MIFYISQKVLNPPYAVAKCAVATGRLAFMGGLSPALYRLDTGPPRRKRHKYWRQQNIGALEDFTKIGENKK